jgi:hypothetical protein
MEHILLPGTWCRPANETQWNLILDMAKSIGMGYDHQHSYAENSFIWSSRYSATMDRPQDEGLVGPLTNKDHNNLPPETSVQSFLSQMLSEAERRKASVRVPINALTDPQRVMNHIMIDLQYQQHLSTDTNLDGKPLIDPALIAKLEAKVFPLAAEKTSGLTFEEAVQFAMKGKDARRKGFAGVVGPADIIATDWEVVS